MDSVSSKSAAIIGDFSGELEDFFENGAIGLHIVGADGGDEFVALDLQHAWIVRALDHEQRLPDVCGMEERRDAAVTFGVGRGIAHLVVERFAERGPPRRDRV